MYSESMEEFKGSYEQEIDLTGKAKGVYFLEINTLIQRRCQQENCTSII